MKRTQDDIANEVILTKQTSEALVLIVEGYSDEKTFRKFLVCADSEIISSWGKNNALAAMAILEHEGIVGVFAIVDADFWHLEGKSPTSANVIVTDDHDLEMMIIHSNSFDHFIIEVTSTTKMKKFLLKHNAGEIRDILFEHARPIGLLRRYSHENGLNLHFNDLNFSKFIAKDTFTLDLKKMIQRVLARTRNSTLNVDVLISQTHPSHAGISDDPYQICCGHDVIAVLGIGLRKCIGSKSSKETSVEALERELRMSYDSACFKQTQLYSAAEEWSRNNAPYRVFA